MKGRSRDQWTSASHRVRRALPLVGTGLLSCLGYWILSFGIRADGEARDVWTFLGVLSGLFGLYFATVVWIHRSQIPPRATTILAWAIAFRILLLPAGLTPESWTADLHDDVTSASVGYRPFLLYDNDVWRYLWDGHVSAHGFDPFADTPRELELLSDEGDPAAEMLFEEELWQDIFDRTSFHAYRSVYPPAAQLLFRGLHWVAPGSVLALKLILVAFDLGTCFLVVALLRRFQRPTSAVLLYAWNPLAIKEIAGSGHLDAMMIFFLVLAVYWLVHRRTRLSLVAFGLSVLSKLTPILVVGLFLRRSSWRHWPWFGTTLLAGFLPYVYSWAEILRGIAAFSREWMFNPGLWALWKWTAEALNLPGRPIASAVSGALTLAVIAWTLRRDSGQHEALVRGIFLILGAYLVLSATVMPWYLLWALPFVAIRPGFSWLVLTWLSLLSYLIYIDQVEHPVWLWIEFSVYFAVLGWEVLRAPSHPKQASSP
ncbi:MAG: DUF2029 domain-containing protein [Thermoanaerobaculia bacterium]|nr:DUF2029 domain-containing protein [Thermoanaerobaculia bacterium]